jgi:hypothetical protein
LNPYENENFPAYGSGIRTTFVVCVGPGARAGKKQFTRVVPSGTNQRIGFFHAVHPDCTASGDIKIRVTKQPEHGSAETTTAMIFPGYPKENIRYKCDEHKVKGMQVNYKSAEKYTGSDELELLIFFPAGIVWEVHFDISVR